MDTGQALLTKGSLATFYPLLRTGQVTYTVTVILTQVLTDLRVV